MERDDEALHGDPPRVVLNCVTIFQYVDYKVSCLFLRSTLLQVDPSALSTMRGDIEAHRTAQNAHAEAAAGAAEAADTTGSHKVG